MEILNKYELNFFSMTSTVTIYSASEHVPTDCQTGDSCFFCGNSYNFHAEISDVSSTF